MEGGPHQQAIFGIIQLNADTLPGDGASSHRLRAQCCKSAPAMSGSSGKPRLCPVLLTTGSRLEVPETPSSSSITLREWLTELGETFYSLDHWFITKGLT